MKSAAFSLTAGLLLSLSISVTAATRYVNVNSSVPAPPYTNWISAATSIQAGVDAARAGDTVLVTNGVYAAGGRAVFGAMTNRVAVDRPVEVRSVNGPAVTVIQGYQVPGTTNGDGAIRCVYLTNGAVLSGFRLTNGATRDYSGDYDSEQSGGGVWCQSSTALVTNCTLTGNSAYESGGGAYSGTLNNCILTGNSSGTYGGGTCYGTLNNCTLAGNSATGTSGSGGGAYGGTLKNCMLYYNTASNGPNYDTYSTLSYCCTTPLPDSGVGNISAEPQLASASHLSAGSPCRGAGSAAYSTGVDIDGEAWLSPPSIGCDEYRAGSVTGPLTVAITMSWTNVGLGFAVDLTGWISGRVTASAWDFGNGTILSNRPYASHAWGAAGDYPVVLRAYNESHLEGVSATATIRVVGPHYVSAASVIAT